MSTQLKSSNLKTILLVVFGLFFAGIALCWGLGAYAAGAPVWVAFFAAPFLLVGLGVMLAGATQILAGMKVGKPEVTVSSDTLRVGETFSFSYRQSFKKRAEVKQILFQLLQRESATYRRGTDTVTVTHEDIVRKFEHPGRQYQAGEIFYGDHKFQIPPTAMHTFKGNNNKIGWFIRVKVAFAGWPDLKREYFLTVLPEKIEEERYG